MRRNCAIARNMLLHSLVQAISTPVIPMSRNNKLLLKISSLLIVGFLITSLASFFVSRKSLRSEIQTNTLPLTGDNIYSEIQRDLLRPVFISSLMASDTFLRDWILLGETETRSITKYLKEIKKKYNTFTAFLVSEKTRTYYHADGILKTVSKSASRDDWYFRVKDLEDDYEINVDPDMANRDAMTIFVNYRVYDYSGGYIGATGVGLKVSAVKRLLEDYQKKYNRSIYFISENGDLQLAGSDFSADLKNIHKRRNFPSFTKENIAEHQYYSYSNDGKLTHVNIRYIPEFDWFLVVEQPEKQATRQISRTLFINLAICLLITGIVAVLVNMTVTIYRKRIETLSGIVPICSYCKQIRDDKGYWNQVEAYISRHTEAEFSHGICPKCLKKHYPYIDHQ